MTPSPEKAAPIPAEVLALAEKAGEHFGMIFPGVTRAHTAQVRQLVKRAIMQDRADRASQEERIREDERGLRGKVVYPCVRFSNDGEFRDHGGYVIVKAERAATSEGRPGPMYYTLVSDTGDVRTLLSTLFTRDADRASLRGGAS